ncbi:MAG TPA: 2-dehydropantoate 2-reductase N-terminal domain-containing protein, partial [Paraburkholderia sp.]
MRILVVGAGALGGYFGGRLIEAGRDVTFLVRAGRAEELKRSGLVIRSTYGNATLRDVPTVLADGIRAPYDLVLLSCKAYNLDDAIESFAPAVGPSTMILPVLNGMSHIDALKAKFGDANVLGGLAFIAATL